MVPGDSYFNSGPIAHELPICLPGYRTPHTAIVTGITGRGVIPRSHGRVRIV